MLNSIRGRWCLWGLCQLAALPAHAGPTFEETLARHRALATGAVQPDADAVERPIRLTAAAGAPPAVAPRMVAPALRVPEAGVRLAGSHCLTAPSGGAPTDNPCAAAATLSLTAALGNERTMAQSAALEGSALRFALPIGEAYASVQTRHWGPGWAGSLILDGAAVPLPAVGWRVPVPRAFETPALTWLGRWSADVFAGALEGHHEPERPWLIGMRFELEPVPGVQIGLSRTMQWGGSGRDESLKSLLHALVGHDNGTTVPGNSTSEPGNQLAGYDVRVALPFGADRPLALYLQAIGEDEAGGLPSKFNALAGADLAWRTRGVSGRVFVEWVDTQSGRAFGSPHPGIAYRHHIYRQGYTHAGAVLGHPIGGDARITSAGLIADTGAWSAMFAVHQGRAAEQAQTLPPQARLSGLDAAVTAQIDAQTRVGLTLWSWRLGDAGRETALQATAHWAW